MGYVTFYNKRGKPTAYIANDGKSIFTFKGAPVAYLAVRGGVFAYDGSFLGWFEDGWIIDHSGDRVFFTSDAKGGPVKPVKAVRPVRGVKRVRPVKRVKEVRPVHPVVSLSWSDLSAEQFFK